MGSRCVRTRCPELLTDKYYRLAHSTGLVFSANIWLRTSATSKKEQAPFMASLSQLLQDALSHHRTGQLQRARELYCIVLERDPAHADAWHLLGMVLYQAKQHEMAIECIKKALAIRAGDADFHANYGAVLRAAGKLDLAEASYRRALAIRPRETDFHSNLGVVLMEQGKHEDAEKAYRQALTLAPNHLLALVNLGNWFRERGELAEAIPRYRKALQIQPNHFEALCNLGNT